MNELLAAVPKHIVETVAIVELVLAIIVKLLFGHGALDTFIPQMAVFAVAAFRLLPSVGKINAYVNSVMYNKASLDMIYQDLREIEKISRQRLSGPVKQKTGNLNRVFLRSISRIITRIRIQKCCMISAWKFPKGKRLP